MANALRESMSSIFRPKSGHVTGVFLRQNVFVIIALLWSLFLSTALIFFLDTRVSFLYPPLLYSRSRLRMCSHSHGHGVTTDESVMNRRDPIIPVSNKRRQLESDVI